MIKKIVRSGDPILRKTSKPVLAIDEKIKELVRDLKDTLKIQKDPEGVGLAAPQIGKNLRVFVMDYKEVQRVVINPEIVSTKEYAETKTNKSGKKDKVTPEILEGCLSLPNYYGPLIRVSEVTIKYQDENGKEITETFEGFYAQIVMHEIDHLNGYLFIDRLLEQKKQLFKLEGEQWEEVELS